MTTIDLSPSLRDARLHPTWSLQLLEATPARLSKTIPGSKVDYAKARARSGVVSFWPTRSWPSSGLAVVHEPVAADSILHMIYVWEQVCWVDLVGVELD